MMDTCKTELWSDRYGYYARCAGCGATIEWTRRDFDVAKYREWQRLHQAPLPFSTPAERPEPGKDEL